MLKKKDKGGGVALLYQVERRANFSNSAFPDVLKNGMNFMNFVNFPLKSITYNVNAEKQNVNFMNFSI
jgi:hypothetical protein